MQKGHSCDATVPLSAFKCGSFASSVGPKEKIGRLFGWFQTGFPFWLENFGGCVFVDIIRHPPEPVVRSPLHRLMPVLWPMHSRPIPPKCFFYRIRHPTTLLLQCLLRLRAQCPDYPARFLWWYLPEASQDGSKILLLWESYNIFSFSLQTLYLKITFFPS